MSRLAGLYAVTPARRDEPCAAVGAALRGGARIVQYRDKSDDAERRRDEARQLAALCHAVGALLVINDDVALARDSGADGVHLGRDDIGIPDARALLGPDAVIGASCYDSLALARAASAQGADYVAFGSFFPSRTKPAAVRAPLRLLKDARAELDLPICAIGGITPENGGELLAAGADMLAVVDGVFGAPDIEAAARAYSRLWTSK